MSNTEGKNRCIRCELEKLMANVSAGSIEQQAKSMAYREGITAEDSLYEKRMEICRECPALQGGILCTHSGSYAAFRAKIKGAACPMPGNDKWAAASRQLSEEQ